MKKLFVRRLLAFLIGFVLQNTRLNDVLQLIEQAEAEYTNNMQKRGFVYRSIKSLEPEDTSQTAINLALEGAVYLLKRL